MEIEILKDENKEFKFKLKGETHTLLNLLSKELLNYKSIDYAGYQVEHPLINEATFSVKGTSPKKTIKSALKKIKKKFEDFQKEVKDIKE